MKAPLEWIKEMADISVSAKEFADKMTLSGSKAEGIINNGEAFENVVVGAVREIIDHPDSDHLHVLSVDVGTDILKIVCGAPNVRMNMKCPVALTGAVLPGGFEIKRAKLRGVESFGMCCSAQELGLDPKDYAGADPNGLWVLPESAQVGMPMARFLGLEGETIEFEITSNRPDCFSIEGLAREAAITFDARFVPIRSDVREEGALKSGEVAQIEILAPDLCYRYCSRTVEDVVVGPSPSWMQNHLRAAGIRPINNIVDITNYVCIELGQPMHAFDLEYLSGKHIIVRTAEAGEKTVTIDKTVRELNPSVLVIADEKKVCAIAGVMGSENSEVQESTRTVLFESATFNPVSVRKTALSIGLRTEASSRYEKGLDPENALRALNRACELVEKLGCGKVSKGIIDIYPTPRPVRKIRFFPDRINTLLGTDISTDFMQEKLAAVGCSFDTDNNGVICIPPSFRPDLECMADLAEEVARFYDYNNIRPTLSGGQQTTLGGRTFEQNVIEKIKDTMVSQGFYEAITYSFESIRDCDRLMLPQDHFLRKQVVVRNPLGEEYSAMRTSMVPSMLRIAARNANRSVSDGSVFEVAYVYWPSDQADQLPTEKRILSAVIFDANASSSDTSMFFRMKGAAEKLFSELRTGSPDCVRLSDCPYLHPGRAASISFDGTVIGQIGYIRPEAAEQFEAPESSVILVIETDELIKRTSSSVTCVPLPKYPGIARDLSVLVDKDIPVGTIQNLIRRNAGEYLETCTLFDVYSGKQIGENKKSVAFNLYFRSPDRTLTESDIKESMTLVLKILSGELGAQLR